MKYILEDYHLCFFIPIFIYYFHEKPHIPLLSKLLITKVNAMANVSSQAYILIGSPEMRPVPHSVPPCCGVHLPPQLFGLVGITALFFS